MIKPGQLNKEGNEETKAVQTQHEERIVPRLGVILVFGHVPEQPLLLYLAWGLLKDVSNEIAHVIGRPGEVWSPLVIVLEVEFALLVHIVLDILHLLFEVVLPHVYHQAVNEVLGALDWPLLLDGPHGDVVMILPLHVLWLLQWERLQFSALRPRHAVVADLAAEVYIVISVLLRDEIGVVGLLFLRSFHDVHDQAHQVLLSLVMKWLLTVIIW